MGYLDDCGTSSADALDAVFLTICAMMIFNMQLGFAFLEAGSVSVKATIATLFKNVFDIILGSIAYLACGYAFSFGKGEFIGGKGFFLQNVSSCKLPFYFFQAAFAATCTTIISGAVAGRASTFSYVVYSIVVTGFVFPAVVHWTWSDDAWLFKGDDISGFRDFAGSGVVHLTGGICALVGAMLLKPRKNRLDGDGEFRVVRPHSVPLVAMGGLVLVVGFFAFNAGSMLTLQQSDGTGIGQLGLIVINTLISTASGGLMTTLIDYHLQGEMSLLAATNGMLAGAVASCAGAQAFEPWACLLVGGIGGIVYMIWSALLIKFGIDDAVNAAPVHAGAGAWGLFAHAFFSQDLGIFYASAEVGFNHLGWQLLGVIVITAWSAVMSVIMFYPLKMIGRLRVKQEYEEQGLDLSFYGGHAYDILMAAVGSQQLLEQSVPKFSNEVV